MKNIVGFFIVFNRSFINLGNIIIILLLIYYINVFIIINVKRISKAHIIHLYL